MMKIKSIKKIFKLIMDLKKMIFKKHFQINKMQNYI